MTKSKGIATATNKYNFMWFFSLPVTRSIKSSPMKQKENEHTRVLKCNRTPEKRRKEEREEESSGYRVQGSRPVDRTGTKVRWQLNMIRVGFDKGKVEEPREKERGCKDRVRQGRIGQGSVGRVMYCTLNNAYTRSV
jgi:hypothetical protein